MNIDTVLQVGNGIAHIHGLDEVMEGELIECEEGTIGIALNLESNNVVVVLMGDGLMIKDGSYVKAMGRIAQIPVSEDFLGRVINALLNLLMVEVKFPFFLGAHFVWAFSLMFLFSGRGYWQELIESIVWAHNK